MKNVSLRNYGDKEEVDVVNTPKSIEACYREGAFPEDLLYSPFEDFARPNVPKEIQQMNYNFFETQRKKLLRLVKAQYQKLLTEKKRQEATSDPDLKEIVQKEIQRLKSKNLKYISKYVNYKLDNVKLSIEEKSAGNKQTNEFLPAQKSERASETGLKKNFSKSSGFSSTQGAFFSQRHSNNYKRDAAFLSKEREEYEKLQSLERQKNLEIEMRRKITENRQEARLRKVKLMRELEQQEKIEKIVQKEEKCANQLQGNFMKKFENKKQKILDGLDKFTKVVQLKQQFDEYHKEIRDKIVKEENDKIATHAVRKQQFMLEFKEKIKEKNQKHDLKSLSSREKIKKTFEERREKTSQELQKRGRKLMFLKEEQEKLQEINRQKLRLKEVEREWNIQRANRKDDFWKNEVMSGIRSSFTRVQKIQSAKDLMFQVRYDLSLKSETQKAKIDNAIYQMEVQKKFNFESLNNILADQIDEERLFIEAPNENTDFFSTK